MNRTKCCWFHIRVPVTCKVNSTMENLEVFTLKCLLAIWWCCRISWEVICIPLPMSLERWYNAKSRKESVVNLIFYEHYVYPKFSFNFRLKVKETNKLYLWAETERDTRALNACSVIKETISWLMRTFDSFLN